MNITYVGPHDAVEIDSIAVVCKRGETISVAADVAGKPPSPRVAAAHAELHAAITAIDHDLAAALRAEIVTLDYGSGLLAQPDNWQPAKETKDKVSA
jgi:hypothetical protein